MFGININTDAFVNLTQRQMHKLPDVTAFALNQAAFKVKQGWGEELAKVFDRPTPFTRSSALYRKATRDHLVAEVYIKDDVGSGNPPARYLQAEVLGGARRQKAFEKALQKNPRARKFYVPGKGIQLDQYGNVPAGLIRKVLAQLQLAPTDIGHTNLETEALRGRRVRRQKRKGGGGRYFMLPTQQGKLKPGVVYERIETGFGSAVRSVLFGSDAIPHYTIRFHSKAVADRLFHDAFTIEFRKGLEQLLRLRK